MNFVTTSNGRTAFNLDTVKFLMVCKEVPYTGIWKLEAFYPGGPVTLCKGSMFYCEKILAQITNGRVLVSGINNLDSDP